MPNPYAPPRAVVAPPKEGLPRTLQLALHATLGLKAAQVVASLWLWWQHHPGAVSLPGAAAAGARRAHAAALARDRLDPSPLRLGDGGRWSCGRRARARELVGHGERWGRIASRRYHGLPPHRSRGVPSCSGRPESSVEARCPAPTLEKLIAPTRDQRGSIARRSHRGTWRNCTRPAVAEANDDPTRS